ncbi:hypothetical protein ACFOSC_26455 [Streptantibioticus rubrisoli]|uniref:Uncharacterized protein n=1 Tax=Streptantibioticus rubrisoli TaxID=1387313 RepID=A0ABT1PEU3_9ACTN|nr:hypothetical protein [Streptantibioticus rubrisoli]MCQ4043880.1 hypothetical protein [Streptantibioticus rubrisoli]
MKPKFPIPRPTEHAAIRAAEHSSTPLPPVEALFDRLVTAQAVGDQHGSNLFGHAIARAAGSPPLR